MRPILCLGSLESMGHAIFLSSPSAKVTGILSGCVYAGSYKGANAIRPTAPHKSVLRHAYDIL